MIFFAGIESLVPLLIFAAFALLSRWLKNKARREEADDYADLPRGPQRQRQRRQQPAASKSWEEELRDLLEQRPAPAPARREIPPPIIYAPQTPPPVPEEERGIEVTLNAPPPLRAAEFQPFHGLSEAEQRYQHASSLHERVAQRMDAVTRRPATSTAAQTGSATARRALNLIRSRDDLRAVMVANVILGPPRGIEESR